MGRTGSGFGGWLCVTMACDQYDATMNAKQHSYRNATLEGSNLLLERLDDGLHQNNVLLSYQ
jgi:hypothetical protein